MAKVTTEQAATAIKTFQEKLKDLYGMNKKADWLPDAAISTDFTQAKLNEKITVPTAVRESTFKR